MSKYNNMKSINIADIPDSEIKQAIKEWSEGDSYLEKLLLDCMENKVETFGCHAGSYPYLDIIVNNSYDQVKNMIQSIQDIDGVTILVLPDGGNPRSSDNFYKASISIGFHKTLKKNDADTIFTKMSDSFKKSASEEEIFDIILDFYKFFEEKESNLLFYMKYISNNYIFDIKTYGNHNIDYFDKLFKKCDLEKIETSDSFVNCWEFAEKDSIKFRNKMKQYYNLIINNWSLDIPNEVSEDMNFDVVVRIKRRQFGDTLEGKKKFKAWLKEEIKLLESSVK